MTGRFWLAAACALAAGMWLRADAAGVRVSVTDAAGAPVAGATVTVRNAQQTPVRNGASDEEGRVTFEPLPAGSYVVEAAAPGLETRRATVWFDGGGAASASLRLSPAELRTEITVTPSRSAEEVAGAAHLVTIADAGQLSGRPSPTIGNALENSPGVLVQQSAYGQVSLFLRGLTGYHVLNLVDAVRFNNSTFRSGPNQYLAFLDPSQAQHVEVVLGPTGAQYGSDALGGAIHVVTEAPRFGDGSLAAAGEVGLLGGSADLSRGGDAKVSLANGRLFWLGGASGRRHGDLRAGGAADSRNVYRRLFALDARQIRELTGSRLQDTGFSQYGVYTKIVLRLPQRQSLTGWYQHSALDGVRGYKDLLGGLGRLQSAFEPQGLHFFYARYEKLRAGPLDSLSGTFSVNSQADGSIRQGLRLSDTIVRDRVGVDVFGYSTQATSHIGRRQALVFGADVYDERIGATRFDRNPATGQQKQVRALYPDGSRYATLGLFGQDAVEFVPGKLRMLAGARLTAVRFRAFAGRNLDAAGRPFGVADSRQTFRDLAFNTSLLYQATPVLGVHALVGRGFRAPNLNDLGAIGLNDLGYEIPAGEAIPAGALLAASAGEDALPAGGRLRKLEPERLSSYEAGFKVTTRRLYARAHVFDAELTDPIVRRTLLFPAGQAPAALAGLEVTPVAPTPAQLAAGVVGVATALDPRAVKAFVNDGHSRYYGVESLARYAISSRWAVAVNYTFLAGRDLHPNRPIRRLPPQQGYASVRYTPSGRRPWLELGATATGAQRRLSGGDRDDERIGASRRRADIADFFSGALAGPFVSGGVFLPTGETLAQIRDRVLPVGAVINGVRVASDTTRVPLYLATAGWFTADLRGGFALGECASLHFAVMNLLDRNYRVHGSGLDAPGVNAWIGLRYRF